jgi:phage terminase large subunit-like protein
VTLAAGLWGRVADAFAVRGYASPWRDIARPGQLPPPWTDGWLIWLILAGRGAGKTRSGAETTAEFMRRYPGCRVALVAATFADGRDTMVEGESGLLSVLDDSELRGGSRDTAWNRSIGELYLENGSVARVFSSERPDKLRGPQHHLGWCDELVAWRDAHRDRATIGTTWSNLTLGLRLPRLAGWPADYAPRAIVTTTPARVAMIRVAPSVAEEQPERAGLTQMGEPTVVITKGRTHDNLANLADAFRKIVVEPLQGTRLGRQELDAELLDDVQGAMLQQAWIDDGRRRSDSIPPMVMKAIGVDPAKTSTEAADLTGIVTCGMDATAEAYVFNDLSDRYTPEEWSLVVWQEAIDQNVDVIVVEDNVGGEMVETVLKAAWLRLMQRQVALGNPPRPRPPIVRVTPAGAAQSKWLRATSIALLYEQQPGRIHHVMPVAPDPADGTGSARRLPAGRNPLALLEDEATTWTGGPDEDSPDRVDAAVHCLRWLLFPGTRAKGRDHRPEPAKQTRWSAAGGRR